MIRRESNPCFQSANVRPRFETSLTALLVPLSLTLIALIAGLVLVSVTRGTCIGEALRACLSFPAGRVK